MLAPFARALTEGKRIWLPPWLLPGGSPGSFRGKREASRIRRGELSTRRLSYPVAPPVPWTPALLPGLMSWARSDSLLTFNGSNVSAWGDLSGHGNGWSQATAANQPPYHASGGANNQPYLQFTNGSGLFLNASATTSFNALLIWIVMRPTWPGSAVECTLIYLPNPVTAPAINTDTTHMSSVKETLAVFDGATTEAGVSFNQNVDAAVTVEDDPTGFSAIWNDNTTVGSNSNDASNNPEIYSSSAIIGAAFSDGSGAWNGFVYEVALSNATLTNAQLIAARANLESYGHGRYGT